MEQDGVGMEQEWSWRDSGTDSRRRRDQVMQINAMQPACWLKLQPTLFQPTLPANPECRSMECRSCNAGQWSAKRDVQLAKALIVVGRIRSRKGSERPRRRRKTTSSPPLAASPARGGGAFDRAGARALTAPPERAAEGAERAWDLRAWDLRAWDLRAWDLRARDLRAWDLRAWDLRAWDLRAWDLRELGSWP